MVRRIQKWDLLVLNFEFENTSLQKILMFFFVPKMHRRSTDLQGPHFVNLIVVQKVQFGKTCFEYQTTLISIN